MRRRDKQKLRLQQEQHYRDNIRFAPSELVQTVGPKIARSEINALSVPSLQNSPLVESLENKLPIIEAEVIKTTHSYRSIPLVILAYALGIVGLGINGWFSYSRGSSEVDKALFLGLGFILEAIMFYLPAQTANQWRDRKLGGVIVGCFLYPFLFIFAITNSLGFASLNLQDTATARAERVTPAISDAQRKLDTLTTSRAVECVKRGDKCRQLEREEQQALESLREAREKVSATADPQVTSAAKLVSWVSLNRYAPTPEDFAMLRLLLLTLLPQLGGLVLMLSQRS